MDTESIDACCEQQTGKEVIEYDTCLPGENIFCEKADGYQQEEEQKSIVFPMNAQPILPDYGGEEKQ